MADNARTSVFLTDSVAEVAEATEPMRGAIKAIPKVASDANVEEVRGTGAFATSKLGAPRHLTKKGPIPRKEPKKLKRPCSSTDRADP
jgi:hypothetical protein